MWVVRGLHDVSVRNVVTPTNSNVKKREPANAGSLPVLIIVLKN